jgi:SSS family solute:Na+ symporter
MRCLLEYSGYASHSSTAEKGKTLLLWFVIAYWIISVGIGLWAASRVRTTRDFAIAGRHLPFYMVTATVFATWFGAETVLGIPAIFLGEGLHGVVADPFGSSMCLILVGLFFAAPLYRMRLLTIGDFYKKRYGRKVEVLTTLAIVIPILAGLARKLPPSAWCSMSYPAERSARSQAWPSGPEPF